MGGNKPRVFTQLNKFIWPTCTRCAWSRVSRRFTAGKTQDICLPLLDVGWRYIWMYTCPRLDLMGNTSRWKTWLGPSSGNPEMYLVKANSPGQYLIKACFKCDFKLWFYSWLVGLTFCIRGPYWVNSKMAKETERGSIPTFFFHGNVPQTTEAQSYCSIAGNS